MVLLPKPQKPPTSPGNLRPISILPAIAKTLARATAQAYPQFAYANRRQTLDALDRVHSHCTQVKKRIAAARPQPFAFQPRARPQLQGGMQLSLDLRQAFDRLPRAQLEASLQRISVPPNLISLIMYLHFEMLLVFTKDEYMEEIRTSTGIRQGCGLAPRLWASFTLLTFEKLQQHVSKNQLTFYADDYHVSWNIFSGLQLRNACIQASKIIDELQDSGMQIAIEKTVIIIALGGTQTTQATKDPIQVSKKGRTIRIPTKAGVLQVPVKREHVYLGVKIGYSNWERSPVAYRIKQSWQRLHRTLISKALPERSRIRLWVACIRSVLFYGLSTILLDGQSLDKSVLKLLSS